jgi:hypothetical protein
VVEPLLQPTSDVIWTTVPAQSQATDVGLSNNRRHGVLVVPGGDFNAIARFDSAGRHEMTLSAAVPFADFAEVEIELDGRSIHREKRFGPAHQMSAATAKFVVDRPGTHDFRISVVSDEDRAPALWIDFVRVESLETPVKYAMPGFGVAALCINADDGSHRTWAMTTSLDRNMARKLWRSLDAHIRELPKGSLLFLVFKGPVSELIDAGHSQIQAILENTGGEARWIDRLRTQPGLLITGATNAFDGAARIRALPESTYRYWDAGQEPVPGGMPLPWRFGVANTRPVLPLRDPGYAAFHVPMTFVPGVFFLPTSVDTDKPYGMVESYLEGSMRNESRLKSRFSRTLDEHRVHILEKCLKPQPGVAEPVRVVSFDQFKGGEAGRGLGFPLKRVVVVEPRWTTLQQATVAGLKSSYAVHLVMQIDHPERVEGIQFVLRTPKDESILWCPVPKLFEQTAAFDFSLDEFKINEQADAADVVSAELRLISRDRKPVQVDIFDLCIVDVSRAPVIPG